MTNALLVFVLAATGVGSCLLGIVAISDIKHSQGRITGIGLAFFDAIFFPLVLLDGLIVTVSPWPMILTGLTIIIMDVLILVLAWHAVRQEQNAHKANAANTPHEPHSGDRDTKEPRSILGRAWDDWWAQRERWLTGGVQMVLCLVFVVCLIMYLSFQSSSERVLNAEGQWLRHTRVTIGVPDPWFDWETYPDAQTPFRWKIDWISTSTGIMLVGFVAWCVNWQIEKAKAKLSDKKLRWWHGSPNFAIAFWGVATLLAVAMGIGVAELPQRLDRRAANKQSPPSEQQVESNAPPRDVKHDDWENSEAIWLDFHEMMSRPLTQNWIMTSDGPVLTDGFVRVGLELDATQTDELNRILQDTYSEYLKIEQQYLEQQKAGDKHVIITIKPYPEAVAKLEDRLWTQLDAVLDPEQQSTARLNLQLGPPEAAAGRALTEIVGRGFFGWGKDGAEIEIRQVGTWYHWKLKTRGYEYDSDMYDGEAAQLPEWLHRFWKERGDDNATSSRAAVPEATLELIAAAGRGDATRVKSLLDFEGASVNDKDDGGKTALMAAAEGGHASLAATLMLLGANVNERDVKGRTPLMYAAENGHSSVLRALWDIKLASMTSVNVEEPSETRIARLLALPGIDTQLLAGAKLGLRDVEIDFDARDNAGETAQMKAAAGGHIDWFRELKKLNQANDARSQDRQGRTVLMHAVATNQLALVRQLADELHDVSLGLGSQHLPLSYNRYFEAQAASLTAFSGHTALQLAAKLGHTKIADIIRSEMQRTIDTMTAVLERKELAPVYLQYRGYAWRALGEEDKAVADFKQAQELRIQTED